MHCPDKLSPAAREEWDRIISELAPFGILTGADAVPLAIYCNAFAHWQEAVAAVALYGTVIKSPNGFPSISPYVSIMNQQADTMMRIATEFGFTPASRRRLPKPPEKNGDPLGLELLSALDLEPLR